MSILEIIKSWFCRSENKTTLDIVLNHPSEINDDDLNKILDKAKEGDIESELFAGVLYLRGERVQQDIEKAMEYLDKSARAGHVQAQKVLAKEYLTGMVFPHDKQRAFELFEKAAYNGDVEAMHNLGLMHEKGIYVEKNISKALECFQRASDENYVESKIEMADLYFEGVDVPMDRLKACQIYKYVITLDTSKFNVGRIYKRLGRAYADKLGDCGITREEGIEYLKKAIDAGHFSAAEILVFLGEELDEGNRRWLFELSTQHQDDPHFILVAGVCYEKGYGTFQDVNSAFNCYKKAAELGNVWGTHFAACSYLNGSGVERSAEEWFRLETEAADKGLSAAQYDLGISYLNGIRLKQDREKGLNLLRQAAAKHRVDAVKALQEVDGGGNPTPYDNATPQSSPDIPDDELKESITTPMQVQPHVDSEKAPQLQGPQEVEKIQLEEKSKLEYRTSEDFH